MIQNEFQSGTTRSLELLVPGLWRWVSAAGVNSYVWKHEQEIVLIDPAYDLDQSVLQASSLARPSHMLATHVQAEHIDGAVNFPGVPFLVPEGDAYLCGGPAVLKNLVQPWPAPWDWDERGNFRGHVAGAVNERPSSKPIAGIVCVSSGDQCAGLRALRSPGQGKHALSWCGTLSDRRSVAFTGDLIMRDGLLWNWFDCDWDYGLESGQNRLLASVRSLLASPPDVILPSHGEVILNPLKDLELLESRLASALARNAPWVKLDFPDVDSPAPGFRQILPCLHQYRDGNCAILVSKQSGDALLVDDGLCHWVPLGERAAHHRSVIRAAKDALGIRRIDIVIPTHYHGDHIENIPDLVAHERAEVCCLDIIADVLEDPDAFNLSCKLPWYGTAHRAVQVDRRIQDGESMRWNEYEIELFHLGGQTFYHLGVSVLVDGQRVMFAGDSLSGLHPEAESILCYNDCEPVDRGWYYALGKMRSRSPDIIIAGHGVATKSPGTVVDAKLASWEERLKQYRRLSGSHDLRKFFDPFFNASQEEP